MKFKVEQNKNRKPSVDLDGEFYTEEATTTITIEIDDWCKEEKEIGNMIVRMIHGYLAVKHPDRAWLVRKYLQFMSRFKSKRR